MQRERECGREDRARLSIAKRRLLGELFESYVFSDIYKSYLNAGKDALVFYYRDKDRKEIDLLLYENGTLHPIEVKKAASPDKSAIKSFPVLDPVSQPEKFGEAKAFKAEIGQGAVVCMATDLLPIDQKTGTFPYG